MESYTIELYFYINGLIDIYPIIKKYIDYYNTKRKLNILNYKLFNITTEINQHIGNKLDNYEINMLLSNLELKSNFKFYKWGIFFESLFALVDFHKNEIESGFVSSNILDCANKNEIKYKLTLNIKLLINRVAIESCILGGEYNGNQMKNGFNLESVLGNKVNIDNFMEELTLDNFEYYKNRVVNIN